HAVLAGRHPFNGKTSRSGSPRNGGGGAPPGLRAYVRTPPTPTYFKPEAATSPFPRLIGRNHHFLLFLSAPVLTQAKISTRRRISTPLAPVRAAFGRGNVPPRPGK